MITIIVEGKKRDETAARPVREGSSASFSSVDISFSFSLGRRTLIGGNKIPPPLYKMEVSWMFTCAAEADVGESVSAENGGAVSDGSRRLEDVTTAAVCDWRRRWRRQIEALHQVVDKVKRRHAWHVPSKFAQQQHFPNLWFVQKDEFYLTAKTMGETARKQGRLLKKRIKTKEVVDGKR